MLTSKEKAAHCECAAEGIFKVYLTDNRAEQEKIKPSATEIAKRLSDYVRVLKPRLIIVAEEAILAARPLERLAGSFLPMMAEVGVEDVCRLVRRDADTVRGVILADPAGWDVDELARATGRKVLTLNGGVGR